MISRTVKLYCDGDASKIENYEEALKDTTQIWHCHHRLETHTSNGGLRPKDAQLKIVELKALNVYYHRPPEELIFLTSSEHMSLHNKGKTLSEYAIGILVKANKGKKVYQATKDKISKKLIGHSVSDETKKKMSVNHNHSARHNCKYILCIETREVFLSGVQLAEKLGVCKQLISRRILEGKPIRGFHYEYKK